MKERFNDLTTEELKVKLEESITKMRTFRFEMVMGHVENPLGKRNLRRNIARLHTLIHEHESGIRKA